MYEVRLCVGLSGCKGGARLTLATAQPGHTCATSVTPMQLTAASRVCRAILSSRRCDVCSGLALQRSCAAHRQKHCYIRLLGILEGLNEALVVLVPRVVKGHGRRGCSEEDVPVTHATVASQQVAGSVPITEQ